MPAKTYFHAWEDGTWVSMNMHAGDVSRPAHEPKAIYWALQRDPNQEGVTALVLGQKKFLRTSGGVDWAKVTNTVHEISSTYTGPVIIDIEAPFRSDGSLVDQYTIDDLRSVALYCKTYRPEAQWGWYGLPTREYWHQDHTWRENNLALIAITEVCDFVAPTIYDYYGLNPERDHKRYGEIVNLAESMASTAQKVIPFVTHRYHNSTQSFGYKLIPVTEHVTHMRSAIAHGADGVIAWGGDHSNCRNAFKQLADGQWVNIGSRWDRVRSAFLEEMGTSDIPTNEQQDTYIFQTLYPMVRERVLTAMGY